MRLEGVSVLGPAGLSGPQAVELAVDGGPETVDANGLILSPGWVDLHVHLRDPGFPEKETMQSAALCAAAGGFTQIVAMANTLPVTDTATLLRTQRERAARAPIRVEFAGAFTRGLEGRTLTDARSLKDGGAVALADDGRHAMDASTLREGLRRAAEVGLPVFVHAQDEQLGSTRQAENRATEQALQTLEQVPGAHLHLQHVSTREAAGMIAHARQRHLRVTAEVTPHHLTLTEDERRTAGALAKVNPPLRTQQDCAALRQALIDEVIDIIATDHAPHELAAKRDWESAAFGISGLDTALATILSLDLPWPVVYRACVAGPRRIIGADLPEDGILVDPHRRWIVDPAAFRSLGRNTPLKGRPMTGAVRMTICRGRVVHASEVLVA